MTDLGEVLASVVEQLGRKRARSDARRVSLDDTEHFVEHPRPETRSGAGEAGGRVGGSDEGIGAQVDVQHRRLSAFEQHILPLGAQVVQREGDVGDQRRESVRIRELLVESLLEVDRGLAEILLQHEVVKVQHLAEPRCETIALEEIGNAHSAARGLVFVSRTDAAAGRTDGIGALRLFARPVQRDVRRQDQRAAGRDAQALEHRNPGIDQHLALGEQRIETQHDAVADEAPDVLAQDSRGNERQHGLAPAAHQRVSGVMATLEARDCRDAICKEVDDLSLALIAPLHPDDDYELAHAASSERHTE